MKHIKAAKIIENRISKGDYSGGRFPAERELADDVGVSRVTLRLALQLLKDKGLIHQTTNKRYKVAVEHQSQPPSNVALLIPNISGSTFSLDLQRWQSNVEQAARNCDARLRTLAFHHWDDPIIGQTLRSFDGVFLVTNSEPVPERVLEQLQRNVNVACLSEDMTHIGIPSLVLFPHRGVTELLNYLKRLGHQRISCFNVQGHNSVTTSRIQRWEGWTLQEDAQRGVTNSRFIVDEQCDAETNIFEFALEIAKQRLDDFVKNSTAVFCTTLPAALGIQRAAADAGVKIGQDLSVCVVDAEGLANHLVPTITSLKQPQFLGCISSVIDWFGSSEPKSDWVGPLLVEPNLVEIFEGESTQPVKH